MDTTNNTNEQKPMKATPEEFSEALSLGDVHTDATEKEQAVAAHAKSVNDGRLKAKSEELKAAQARIKELEEQLRNASTKPVVDYKALAGDKAGVIDEDVLDGMANMVRGASEQTNSRMEAEIRALREQVSRNAYDAQERNRKEACARLGEKVEAAYPGLSQRVSRGDLVDAWRSFKSQEDEITGYTFGEAIDGAMRDGRVGAAFRVFEEFIRTYGLEGQYKITEQLAPKAGAAPVRDPLASDKKTYVNKEEALAAMDKIEQDYRRGTLSLDAKNAKLDEITRAMAEGRIGLD